jgi:hypothetical protein
MRQTRWLQARRQRHSVAPAEAGWCDLAVITAAGRLRFGQAGYKSADRASEPIALVLRKIAL